MIRVVQIIDSLDLGGAERLAVNLANELSAAGHFSALMCTRKEGLLKDTLSSEVTYLSLKRRGTIDLEAVKRALIFIKDHQIDYIQAHSSSYFFATQLKLLKPSLKLVWHNHNGNSRNLSFRALCSLKLSSRFFHSIIAVNLDLKQWALEKLNCDRVYHLDNFTTKPLRLVVKQRANRARRRIVHLANLRHPKNHELLVKAFHQVWNTYPNSSLHLIGDDKNDEYSRSLKALIKSLKIEKAVNIYGSRLDTSELLQTMDIAVLCSSYEGLPISLLEYGMHELPVVVTDVGACKEVVGDAGVVVPSGDQQQLAKGILSYLSSTTFATAQAARFHQQVSQHFGSDAYLDRLIKVFTARV